MTPPEPPQEPPLADRRERLAQFLRHPRTGEFLFDVAKNVTSAVASAAVLFLLGAAADLYPANPTLVRNLALLLGVPVVFLLGSWLMPSRKVAQRTIGVGLGCSLLSFTPGLLVVPDSGWFVVSQVGVIVGGLVLIAGVGGSLAIGPDSIEPPDSRSDS